MVCEIKPNSNHNAKEAVGKAAAALVQDGMLVGLGTGTTSAFFIAQLGLRCRQGLKIKAVASSQQSLELAMVSGIAIADINELSKLDLTIDGADQVDPQKRLIKGAGGALLREKIIANMSDEMVVIIDDKKLVPQLGKTKLPIEIVPFAYKVTMRQIESLGFQCTIRKDKGDQFFITENNNYILDLLLVDVCDDPAKLDELILQIPGVVETGFFLRNKGRVIVGSSEGKVEVI